MGRAVLNIAIPNTDASNMVFKVFFFMMECLLFKNFRFLFYHMAWNWTIRRISCDRRQLIRRIDGCRSRTYNTTIYICVVYLKM